MCPVAFDIGSPYAKEVVGLDIGKAFVKAIIFYDESILSSAVVPIDEHPDLAIDTALSLALKKGDTSRENIKSIVATGRGAFCFKDADRLVENHVCIARGLSYLSRPVRTAMDLGDRAIRGFRFGLKGMRGSLSVDDCIELPLSEVVLDKDIVAVVSHLMARIVFEPTCAIVGGRAKDPHTVEAIRSVLTDPLFLPWDPRIVAALGAAIIAEDTLRSGEYRNLTNR